MAMIRRSRRDGVVSESEDEEGMVGRVCVRMRQGKRRAVRRCWQTHGITVHGSARMSPGKTRENMERECGEERRRVAGAGRMWPSRA